MELYKLIAETLLHAPCYVTPLILNKLNIILICAHRRNGEIRLVWKSRLYHKTIKYKRNKGKLYNNDQRKKKLHNTIR